MQYLVNLNQLTKYTTLSVTYVYFRDLPEVHD